MKVSLFFLSLLLFAGSAGAQVDPAQLCQQFSCTSSAQVTYWFRSSAHGGAIYLIGQPLGFDSGRSWENYVFCDLKRR